MTLPEPPQPEYPKWRPSGEECPKCGMETSLLIDFDPDQQAEIDIGEYCSTCPWFVDLLDTWKKS